ncbi:hypothetical protein ACVIIV_001809 [Bradyrhizobium sp. USDA 4354]
MHEIVAARIHDIQLSSRTPGRADAVERRAHVDIGDDDPERLVVRREQGGRDAKSRNVRLRGAALPRGEIDGRNIDLARRQPYRFLEIGSLALALQFVVGDDPGRSIRAGAIDADQLALVIVQTDNSKLPIAGLGIDLGRKPRRDALAPGLFRDAVGSVDSSAEASADQAIDCRGGAIAGQIAASAGDVRFEIGRQQARLGFDPLQDPRNDGLCRVAIAQPSDGGHGDRYQQDHRDGQPRCQRRCKSHGDIRRNGRIAAPFLAWSRGGVLVIGSRSGHRSPPARPRSGNHRPRQAVRRVGTAFAGLPPRRAWSPSSGSPAPHRDPA